MTPQLSLREVVAERLLATLALRGVAVRVDAGDIVVSAPPGAIEPHEVEALRDHKAEILGLLTEPAPPSTPDPATIGHEAEALASELALIADRLHRHEAMPLPQAEALLATFRAKIAGWREWYQAHVEHAPAEPAKVDAALCRKLRHLHRPAQEVPCEPL